MLKKELVNIEPIYVRPKEIIKIFGISKTTFYSYTKKKNFPKPIRPSKKVTLWNINELKEYFKKFNHKEF